MTINFYDPIYFEQWDHRSPDDRGIGGSETHVCEMAWRLAQRGYDVHVYAPLRRGCPREWRGTTWHPLREARVTEEALWVLVRCPQLLTRRWGGPVWLVMQDVDVPCEWTDKHIANAERIVCMSEVHRKNFVKAHPELEELAVASRNGARVDLLEQIEREENIERNPLKCIYASSPDRGLVQAVLPLWSRVRHFVPDAELHVFYGTVNIDKALEGNPEAYGRFAKTKDELARLVDQPGVHYHERVGQPELYRHWLSTGVWPYFSDFCETSCVASMEASCAGAIPVTRPWWAVGEHVRHGIFVNGSCYDDPLTRSELVAETVRLLLDHDLQEQIREPMMREARGFYHWERVVDQWEAWLHGWPWPGTVAQFAFQHKYLEGRALNVGCNDDMSDLRSRGALNVDMHLEDGWTQRPIPAAVLADGRRLPFGDNSWGTVILGDILEHCEDGQAEVLVREAKRVGRRLVVTCPEDHGAMGDDAQAQHAAREHWYADNIAGWHVQLMTRERLEALVGRPNVYQPIRYWDCNGHGMVVAC